MVAISIPIFTSQLEKSRDAVDMANVRAAYAEAASEYLTEQDGETTVFYAYNIDGKSTDDKWAQTGNATAKIAEVDVAIVKKAKAVWIKCSADGKYEIKMHGTAVAADGKQTVKDKGTGMCPAFPYIPQLSTPANGKVVD